jgi:histone deacetylase 1/2
MAGLADTLASIGQPLRSEDFTTYVLNGLDDDYDNLIENISGRDDPLPRRELYSRLLGREQRVKVKHASPSFSAANAAARGKPQKLPTAGGKSTPGPQQPQRSAVPPVTGGNRPRACCPSCGAQQACQLCGLDNHIASRCHRRFKQDFLGIGNNGKGNDKQAAAAVTGQEHGYTPSYPIDSSWYMDTGATNHLTSEMGKLSTQEPYRGHDQVRTANGAGMRISHVGQASLLAHNSRHLHLRNVLRVPSATRSLLSIPQLTRDNNVLAEFHRFHFFIKDRDTRAVLLRGRLRHGLYALDAPPAPHAPQVFSGVRVSSTHWHARLGHPAAPIVRHVLHRHELPVVSNKSVETICDACQQGKSHQLPFSESSRVVKHPLELVFSDVWGPAQTSVSGHNYYVSFIDAYSRFTWLYLIKRKSDVFDVFIQFQAHVERLLKHKILHVQSDWGVNITTSTRSLVSLGSCTVCLVLIHINRMVPLNGNTATL